MIFRGFARKLLSSRVKLSILGNVLRLYSRSPDDVFIPSLGSERQWAKTIGYSYTAVGNAFEDFQEVNLVNPIFVGNAKAWQVNTNSYAFQILTSELLANILTASPLNKLETLIQAYLSKCQEIDKTAIIFGSIASQTETPTSDIDLLIFTNNEKRAKRILEPNLNKLNEECLKLFGNALMVKFAKPLSSSTPNWVSEAVRIGIKVMI